MLPWEVLMATEAALLETGISLCPAHHQDTKRLDQLKDLYAEDTFLETPPLAVENARALEARLLHCRVLNFGEMAVERAALGAATIAELAILRCHAST